MVNSLNCHWSRQLISPPDAFFTLDTNTPIYVGGVDYPYNYLPESLFEGCIREFTVDGVIQDFSNLASG